MEHANTGKGCVRQIFSEVTPRAGPNVCASVLMLLAFTIRDWRVGSLSLELIKETLSGREMTDEELAGCKLQLA